MGAAYWPLLALVDEDGQVTGIVREEDLRLGLAGRSRPDHPIATLAGPPGDPPPVPVGADGRALPWTPPEAPAVRRALLMAGGRGSRLAPLTDATPKPLLAVEGRPLLHRLLGAAAAAGVTDCWVSVHHLADRVRASVGDGRAFGLEVRYVEEDSPLGTAGAIGLLPGGDGPLLVMNGDILTDVNLTALFAWHDRHRNGVTVATHLFEVDVPFGLAHFDGQGLERLEEKPRLRLPVNAGIYLFEPDLLAEVPHGRPHDMVGWLNTLAGRGVAGQFPIVERWHDIGSPTELARFGG